MERDLEASGQAGVFEVSYLFFGAASSWRVPVRKLRSVL